MGSVQGFRTGQSSTTPTTKAAKPSDRIKLTIMAEHERYMARSMRNLTKRLQRRTIHQQSV